MRSDHSTSNPAALAPHHSGVLSRGRKPHIGRKSVESQSLDLEKEGVAIPTSLRPPMLDLSHYRLVDEVWHYCSVDWSNKCMRTPGSSTMSLTARTDLCVGYNSLSDTGADSESRSTHADEDDSESSKHVKDKPKGARTWTWVCTSDPVGRVGSIKLLFMWTILRVARRVPGAKGFPIPL